MNKELLKKIKVAVFDFDETLAVHDDSDYLTHMHVSEDTYYSYFYNSYLKPETFFEDIEPCKAPEGMVKLVDELRKNNAFIIVLSGMRFSFPLKGKQCFVDRHYGKGIDILTANTQKDKFEAIKIIRRIAGCEFDEMLFVDDMQSNIDEIKTLGVNTLLASEV